MPDLLLDGLGIPESPRWHDGRLWFANWTTGEIRTVDEAGRSAVVAHVDTTVPYSIDWLPDGTLLAVSGQEAALLRRTEDETWATYADLSAYGDVFNEIVVAADGTAFVNGGNVIAVTPDGRVAHVADGLAFGNGMALTADGRTLIVAESHAGCLTAFTVGDGGRLSDRRVWADLAGDAPDGICLDADGAAWYASVPGQHCVRVREGGEVLTTVDVDRGAFACMLGGTDGRTLFIATATWLGMDRIPDHAGSGQIVTAPAPVAHAGRP